MSRKRRGLGDLLSEAVADSLEAVEKSKAAMDASLGVKEPKQAAETPPARKASAAPEPAQPVVPDKVPEARVVQASEPKVPEQKAPEPKAPAPRAVAEDKLPFEPKAVKSPFSGGQRPVSSGEDVKTRALNAPQRPAHTKPAPAAEPGAKDGDLCYGCFKAKAGSGPCPACGYNPQPQNEHPVYLNAGIRLLEGRYIIGRVLGQGGFGVTYLGFDSVLQHLVAIKEYMPTHMASRHRDSVTIIPGHGDGGECFASGLRLFLEEARNVAKLDRHRNVVLIENYFEANNTGYMVMQYVQGPSLSEHLKQRGGKMEWDEVYALFSPILNALEMIHRKNLYHRDISIQNILLRNGTEPVLIDFGAARVVAGEQSRSIDVVLKPGYSPLEQFATKGKIGPWTDIYAVGACMYLMLCGHLPPQATDRLYRDELIPLSEISGVAIPPGVDEDILQALAVRVEDRWQTIPDFLGSLRSHSAERIAPPKKTRPAGPAHKPERKMNTKLLAGAAAAVLLAIGALVFALSGPGKGVDVGVAEAPPGHTEKTVSEAEGKQPAKGKAAVAATAEETGKLEKAAALMAREAYVSPPGNNAFALYDSLLASKTAAGAEARKGVEKLFEVGDNAVERGAWRNGLAIFKEMKNIRAEDLKREVEGRLKHIRNLYVGGAKGLIAQKDAMKALQYLERAGEAAPGDAEVKQLAAEANRITAALNIFCIPSGTVYVDGKDTGRMAPLSGLELVAGTHEIKIVDSSGGSRFPSRTIQVDVQHGKTAMLKYINATHGIAYE